MVVVWYTKGLVVFYTKWLLFWHYKGLVVWYTKWVLLFGILKILFGMLKGSCCLTY